MGRCNGEMQWGGAMGRCDGEVPWGDAMESGESQAASSKQRCRGWQWARHRMVKKRLRRLI